MESNSVFKTIKNKFKIKEKADEPVDDNLASMVNSLFREAISEEQLSGMIKPIHRFENCYYNQSKPVDLEFALK